MLKEQQEPSPLEQIFSELGYAMFRYTHPRSFQPLGFLPHWTRPLIAVPTNRITTDALIELFPGLDGFIDSHPPSGSGIVNSEIWTQTNGNLPENRFRAWWINHTGSYLLVIKKLDKTESDLLVKQLIQTKNQFVSIVSHDLRSPFMSIISALDFLFEDPSFVKHLNQEHSEFLRYIREESKHLLDYLEKLLDLTRLDTGKLQPQIQSINLIDIWKLSRARYESRIAEKNIEVEDSVPVDFMMNADPTLFSQVVNNLLGNAIKFTPRGGTIRFLVNNGSVPATISLIDSGIGIPLVKQNTLFQEYETYYSHGTEGEKGTGLGLSICKKILDLHGYTITCHSEEEKGTEMRISLG